MKFIGIIPSRYESSRFPGKPLVNIHGKSMINRVYEQAKKALDYVYVATDDEKIANEVERFGGQFVITSKHHESGTDRLAEAIEIIQKKLNTPFDVVVNIQGDEPFIEPAQIIELINCFSSDETEIATLIKKITNPEDIFNPNKPKVIFDYQMNAIYFSRSPIPYIRNKEKQQWFNSFDFYRHIGMYAYKTDILVKITRLERSKLEIAESLEQNRWVENGYTIKVSKTDFDSIGIDTPEDLQKALSLRKKD
ncbi:MAG: 3-deoxy-manno-octulosonate cytidylyltransferase [Bacteroidota bacterium]|nr:3-deoxy-manno-octulosonate cytidylyltransferase [Bacteroidota bacterium]